MAIDTSAVLGTITAGPVGRQRPEHRDRRRTDAGTEPQGRGAGQWRFAVHGEQVGAGEAGGGVEVPEVPRRAREHDHLGDRHRLHPDPQVVGRAAPRCSSTGRRTPTTRSPTTSSSTGRSTPRPSGSVIGQYTGVRDAVRDAENSMFLNGTDPKTRAEGRGASNADRRDRGLQLQARRVVRGGQPRSSTGTYGRLVAPV